MHYLPSDIIEFLQIDDFIVFLLNTPTGFVSCIVINDWYSNADLDLQVSFPVALLAVKGPIGVSAHSFSNLNES